MKQFFGILRFNTNLSVLALFIILFLLTSNLMIVLAQESNQLSTVPIPPAPNAASLGRYGDIPVSNYTGIPQISIPFVTVNQGSIELPIGLSYHASGIKVDDIASWVGLGWSLNAGGSITRVVRGLPDESTNGFFNKGYKIDEVYTAEYLNAVSRGMYDSESDVYYFNFPSGTGKFYFTYNKEILLEDYQNFMIESPFVTGSTSWRIVNDKGEQFIFGESTVSDLGGKDVTTYSPEPGTGLPMSYVSSWHIQKIISADKSDTLSFFYSNSESLEYGLSENETLFWSNEDDPQYLYCNFPTTKNVTPATTMAVMQELPSKVVSKNLIVEFIPSTYTRNDIDGGHALVTVKISNSLNSLVKYFNLNYSYFGSNGNYRLRLDGITEHAFDGTQKPYYGFAYNTLHELPERGSYKQDHWGYSNSNASNTFIPKEIKYPDGTFHYYDLGADRDSDPEKTLSGILTEIRHPTGGKTVFRFEPNYVSKVSNFDVKKYNIESHQINSLRGNDPQPFEFTLSEATTAYISLTSTCRGTIEYAVAYAALSRVMPSKSWSVGCGGSNSGSSSNQYEVLKPGTYKMEAFSEEYTESTYSSSRVQVDLYKSITVDSVLAGGARVREIITMDIDNKITNSVEYKYTYNDNGRIKSSGVLVRQPIYYYLGKKAADRVDPFGNTYICNAHTATASPTISLGEGTHIGYKEVKIIQKGVDIQKNGHTVYKYVAADREPDASGINYPFPPPDNRANRRGKLLTEEYYNLSGAKLKEIFYEYARSTTNFHKLSKNLKVGKYWPNDEQFADSFVWTDYYNQQEWNFKSSSTERSYSDSEVLETTTSYYYERPQNHSYATKIQTVRSTGDTYLRKFKYPNDYSDATDSKLSFIPKLIAGNAVSGFVEEQVWKQGYYVSGSLVEYHPDFLKPAKVWSSKLVVPKTSLNNESIVSGKFTTFLSDNGVFEVRQEATFDAGGQLVQLKLPGDYFTSYTWGYKKAFPIARAEGLKQNEFFYTGFEDETSNISPIAKTGVKSRSTAYNITLPSPNTFNLSYWRKVGLAPWELVETTINQNTSIGGTDILIDEVRLYLKGGELTTFSYDPVYGIISTTDSNNVSGFYFYDKFGRLQFIKDEKGNIVKSYQYNYKDQQ